MRVGRRLLCVGVGIAMAISTAARVHVFSDERLIWQSAVDHSPGYPRPLVNLGRQYQLVGGAVIAARLYEDALREAWVRNDLATVAIASMNLSMVTPDPVASAAHRNLAMKQAPYEPLILKAGAWLER